uniref:Putative secreted protein n=1 Tax=Anopheles darlingi TaxID=43151 RepID=A0A2M4DKJ7_ANODA
MDLWRFGLCVECIWLLFDAGFSKAYAEGKLRWQMSSKIVKAFGPRLVIFSNSFRCLFVSSSANCSIRSIMLGESNRSFIHS